MAHCCRWLMASLCTLLVVVSVRPSVWNSTLPRPGTYLLISACYEIQPAVSVLCAAPTGLSSQPKSTHQTCKIFHSNAYTRQPANLVFIFVCAYNTCIVCFYRATACNATHGIAVAIQSICPSVRMSLSVRPSVCLTDACIVTKLNDGLQIF